MAKAKTHEEWYVGVLKKYEQDRGETRYYNAKAWYPNTKLGDRYAKTEEEAKRILEYAYRLWNGEKSYNANGERYETHPAGMLGVTVVSTPEDDERQRIVSHVIKKRVVTEWEEVERT